MSRPPDDFHNAFQEAPHDTTDTRSIRTEDRTTRLDLVPPVEPTDTPHDNQVHDQPQKSGYASSRCPQQWNDRKLARKVAARPMPRKIDKSDMPVANMPDGDKPPRPESRTPEGVTGATPTVPHRPPDEQDKPVENRYSKQTVSEPVAGSSHAEFTLAVPVRTPESPITDLTRPHTAPTSYPVESVTPPAAFYTDSYTDTYAESHHASPNEYYRDQPSSAVQAELAPLMEHSHANHGWAWVAVALGALILTVVLGGAAVFGFRAITNLNNTRATETAELAQLTTATPDALPTSINPEASPTLDFKIQSWNGKERFTLLLLGLDKRPGERGTAFRTDSMIIVSLDPATGNVGILSVPRDLYISIPPNNSVTGNTFYDLQRINSAYVLGELAQPNGGGAQLAMQTVQYNLGIRINDYIVYDFQAVIAAIDAVGGIEINVQEEIIDDQYPDMTYGIERLWIQAGLQHMDGTLALKYARSRHGSGDLDRARRQQDVLYALRDKILGDDLLPTLIPRLPGLWLSMSSNVKSGLNLEQLVALGIYIKDIPITAVKHGVIDYSNVTPTNWNGASVLIPNRATLGPLLTQIFGANYNG